VASSLLVFLLAAGCAADRPADRATDPPPAATADPGGTAASAAAAEPDARGPRVVFLGDSLTAGFGVDETQAFPALVADALATRRPRVEVVNAGVSGDTSAGGLARLDWVLRQQPDVLVVALGANDGLRGLSVEMTEENLRSIIERSRRAGARPVLAGMRLPPNLGRAYVGEFEAVYPRIAADLEVPLVPFLLEGVAAVPELNLPDGIHPNADGHRRVARTVLPLIERVLDELDQS
jgi:acyl-CoA thioesterase-1